METRIKYIPLHQDGHFITIRCERTKKFMEAPRFNTEEELLQFLHSYHGPDNPDRFLAVPIKITYELGGRNDVQ